jgi:hypothetical protein
MDINGAWEIIRENIKFQPQSQGDYEFKRLKPCFDECSKLQ